MYRVLPEECIEFYLKSVAVFETVCDNFSLGHLIQPVQFSTTVTIVVEPSEPLKASLQLETEHI